MTWMVAGALLVCLGSDSGDEGVTVMQGGLLRLQMYLHGHCV